jgi:hypothetical protein
LQNVDHFQSWDSTVAAAMKPPLPARLKQTETQKRLRALRRYGLETKQ